MSFGKLFIIATPIGNLQDITARALETLREADLILCEDTRVTQKLLRHFSIAKPVLSYHQHSDDRRIKEITARIENGALIAFVTDAGTPGISDPGGRLVQELARAFGDICVVTPIPGPSAVMAALSICGFSADEFVFLGFPPHKKGRRSFFQRLDSIKSTIVYFESTHRIVKSLEELGNIVKNRPVVVCRELTKKFETIYRGTVEDVTKKIKSTSVKGEFVIVIAPK